MAKNAVLAAMLLLLTDTSGVFAQGSPTRNQSMSPPIQHAPLFAPPPQRRTLSNAEMARFMDQCSYIGHTAAPRPTGSVEAQQCAAFAKAWQKCGTLFGTEKVTSVFMTRSSGRPFNRKGLNSCVRENYVGP